MKVNESIWTKLPRHSQTRDSNFQIVDNSLTKGSSGVIKLATWLMEKSEMSNDSKQKEEFENMFDICTNSLALLGHAHFELCQRRRELLKNELSEDYNKDLCSKTIKTTQYLFGDKIEERIGDIAKTNRVGSRLSSSNKYSYNSYRGSSNFRGRGRGANYIRYHNQRSRGNSKSRGRGSFSYKGKQQKK